MDRHLNDYLPAVLREVREFKAINDANEFEISRAWDALKRVMANQFIAEADAEGVARWERELNIVPKATDTLDLRKARVKSMWNLELPYTIAWLKEWISAITDNLPFTMSVQDYCLTVKVGLVAKGQLSEIQDLLYRVAPSNMVIDVSVEYNQYLTLGGYTHQQLAAYTHDQLRNEVLE